MPKNIETEIRKALDAKAHEVDVPEALAARTLEIAKQDERSSLRDRVRAWRDTRGSRARVTGYPRVLYAGAATATAVILFVIGTFVVGTDAITPAEPPVMMDAQAGVADGGAGTAGSGRTMEAPVADLAQEEQAKRAAEGGDDTAFAAPQDVDAQGGATTGIAPVPPAPATGKFPPKIVRTANVEVEVRNFDRAWNAANTIATRLGGFVTNSNTETIKDRLGRGSLVMRVPAEKLETAIAELRKLGALANMSTTADDLSAPIADVKARLKALQMQELQLLELMGRADALSETLEVRAQLDSVRQEIESYKAQRDVYENQVQYSTINATIFERGVDPDDPDDGDGILRDAMETALRVGLTIVAGALVVLGGLIPLAALALLVWFVVRTVRRRQTT